MKAMGGLMNIKAMLQRVDFGATAGALIAPAKQKNFGQVSRVQGFDEDRQLPSSFYLDPFFLLKVLSMHASTLILPH